MDTEQLITQLSSDDAPTRPVTNPWLLATKWLVGFAVYMALILTVLMGPRADILFQLQQPLFALEIASLIAMIASCAVSAALLAFPDMYQAPRIARLPIACFVLFALVVGYAFIVQGAPMDFNLEECGCTALLTAFALPPGIYLFYSIRTFASTHAALAGSVAVVAAFGIGALAERLIERTDSVAHVVSYHYLPIFGFALLGVILGRKLLRW
jgi:hypothetical protein